VDEFIAALLLAAGALFAVSLVNPLWGGALGEKLAHDSLWAFGPVTAFLIPALMLILGVIFLFPRSAKLWKTLLFTGFLLGWGTGLLGAFEYGGWLGEKGYHRFERSIGAVGTFVFLAISLFVMMQIYRPFSLRPLLWVFVRAGHWLGAQFVALWRNLTARPVPVSDDLELGFPEDITATPGDHDLPELQLPVDESQMPPALPEPRPRRPALAAPFRPPKVNGQEYNILVDLLDPPKPQPSNEQEEIEAKGESILVVLEQLGRVKGRIVDVKASSRVIRYEIAVPPVADLSRIRATADNIAMSLAARGDVIIQAPVSGRQTIAVEVPRNMRGDVSLRELIQTPAFANSPSPLSVALGKDLEGRPVIASLEDMPHMLVAGSTGSGKSVFLTSTLLSLLYKSPPSLLKLILIDPKQVDLSNFEDIPHLLVPVVTNPKAAIKALDWATKETARRYAFLKEKGMKKVQEFNSKSKDPLPFIVIVIDELNFLLKESREGKEVERCFANLSQIARAAGVHLAVATQRPDAKRLEGGIKANLPARISFKLGSRVDSMIILDQTGAEKLLGKGDMLYQSPQADRPRRLQAPFVSTEELERVCGYVKDKFGKADYDETVMESLVVQNEDMEDVEVEDPALIEEVRHLLGDLEEISVSLLQRRFKIGYNKASRLMDELERLGWVEGKKDNVPGQKTRRVLL
ncbi:MAG: DNA translocase FtsK, partial [bacterium]